MYKLQLIHCPRGVDNNGLNFWSLLLMLKLNLKKNNKNYFVTDMITFKGTSELLFVFFKMYFFLCFHYDHQTVGTQIFLFFFWSSN